MTCFLCHMPVAAARYGRPATLCPECLVEVQEQTELNRRALLADAATMRQDNDSLFFSEPSGCAPKSEHAKTLNESGKP